MWCWSSAGRWFVIAFTTPTFLGISKKTLKGLDVLIDTFMSAWKKAIPRLSKHIQNVFWLLRSDGNGMSWVTESFCLKPRGPPRSGNRAFLFVFVASSFPHFHLFFLSDFVPELKGDPIIQSLSVVVNTREIEVLSQTWYSWRWSRIPRGFDRFHQWQAN